MGASGVFELDVQSELLQPFEGSGVDTSWELLLPKAANPFDFNTIADVLLTMEFTALNSDYYRQQVIKTLRNDIQAERLYSIREHFPDEWYDLNNFDLVENDRKLTVTFQTRPEDFPSNVEVLAFKELVLYFIFKKGTSFEVPANLLFDNYSGGLLRSTDSGILSTRSRADSWKTAFGLGGSNSKRFGAWTIQLGEGNPGETTMIKETLANGDLEDILFAVTYDGKTPEWI
jgi:hypothetical protein